jgi:nucleoside-diphosphate-sugar epimerase
MKIFVAGGSGAIGRELVPMLTKLGHRVTALTRSDERAKDLEQLGAESVVGDVFDVTRLTQVVSDAKPDIVIHQLTAFGSRGDQLAETIRIRIEGTRNLVQAAQAANARRFIAQSISFICSPLGTGLTDERSPLYLDAPPSIRPLANAIAELERQTLSATRMEGVVLRYGWFYGPGTNYDPEGSIPAAVRKGRMAIVGDGRGTYSFISLRDAAAATVCALSRGTGIYNIVDDQPAALSEWLPYVANLLSAPAVPRIDVESARTKLGDMFVYAMNEQRGASNAKAKSELDWRPSKSWREGFGELYRAPPNQPSA